MLFCDIVLAQRIERAETELIAVCGGPADTGAFTIPVGGGVAGFIEPGSPLNKVAGLGFAGLPTAAELDAIEHAFAVRETPVQAEVSSLADPALLELLAGRGYRLTAFENVLGRPLGAPVDRATPLGLEVGPIAGDEFETWLDVVVEATLVEDDQGVPWHEEFPRTILENHHRGTAAVLRHYLARLDGSPAGGGSMRLTDGIAQLTGAGTIPARRRRGVQTALLTTRLADATDAGCDLAVITVQPGSRSQQNAQRRGFELLYNRAILVL